MRYCCSQATEECIQVFCSAVHIQEFEQAGPRESDDQMPFNEGGFRSVEFIRKDETTKLIIGKTLIRIISIGCRFVEQKILQCRYSTWLC